MYPLASQLFLSNQLLIMEREHESNISLLCMILHNLCFLIFYNGYITLCNLCFPIFYNGLNDPISQELT